MAGVARKKKRACVCVIGVGCKNLAISICERRKEHAVCDWCRMQTLLAIAELSRRCRERFWSEAGLARAQLRQKSVVGT